MARYPDDEPLCRHDYWRACYATMLSEVSPEHIVEFFETLPFNMAGRNYAGADLLAHFWDEKGFIPQEWNYDAVNALEPFLVEKGYDAIAFVRKLLFRNNKSTYMPGKIVMSWFYPIMDKLFNVYDPREMIFQLMAVYTQNYLPGHLHPRIKKAVDKDWTHSYLMYLGDIQYKRYRVLNFDYIAGEQIKSFPRMLNLPEFEHISYLTDRRRPEEIVWEEGFERKDDGLHFQGRIVATWGRVHAFAVAHGLEIGKYEMPDWEILVATEDIFCPKRKRVVVYKGCAYEAPVYISVVKHRKISYKEKKFLEHMLTDTLLEGELFSQEVCERHVSLLASQRKLTRFIFWSKDETISLNGEHFTKGVQAVILKKILSAHISEGKSEFEYRDFKRAFEISHGQKNSNFEVRFYRLMDALAGKCPNVRIEKLERGRFSLNVTGQVDFKEE